MSIEQWAIGLGIVAALATIGWLAIEATIAPTIEDEEPIVYGPRAVAVRKEMRAEVIAYHGLEDEVPS
jgi:hypothetical protein